MTTHRNHFRTYLLTAAIAVLALLAPPLTPAADAAPAVTTVQCRTYAYVHHIVTGKPARPAFVACLHARAVQQCLAVHDSNMGADLCGAIVTAKPAWATNRDLHELLRRESTWNLNAVNDSSGACGAFQRLQMHPKPPCPWPVSGVGTRRERVHVEAIVQVRNGIGYITGRYGTPGAALAFHDANGWY